MYRFCAKKQATNDQGTGVTKMTILDYIAANPGCSGGEIAAALNTPT
ncbi:hypothetical protein GQN09_24000, partial [Escherichia coli]|nr:hypothetical protein [Escherichia coli]